MGILYGIQGHYPFFMYFKIFFSSTKNSDVVAQYEHVRFSVSNSNNEVPLGVKFNFFKKNLFQVVVFTLTSLLPFETSHPVTKQPWYTEKGKFLRKRLAWNNCNRSVSVPKGNPTIRQTGHLRQQILITKWQIVICIIYRCCILALGRYCSEAERDAGGGLHWVTKLALSIFSNH